MKSKLLNGNDILGMGFKAGPAIGLLKKYAEDQYNLNRSYNRVRKTLEALKKNPKRFKGDSNTLLREAAITLLPKEKGPNDPVSHQLREKGVPVQVWGGEGIEAGAFDQIYVAAKLPVTTGAALMPDAHQGYGLPIGGVLACENAVIPYGVGVDIACRMRMTILPYEAARLSGLHNKLKNILLQNTAFGPGVGPDNVWDHDVLDEINESDLKKVKEMADTAWKQIGSSGGGNHFVEWGETEIGSDDNPWGLKKGSYISILSHSGSRGFGAKIADYYTRIAKDRCRLPGPAKNLAWLDLDSAEGQEYWIAMNLAGRYAAACHEHIHHKMIKALGVRQSDVKTVENHHNFAWKEIHDGKEVVVHRKGATPAGVGQCGIIPGSMTEPGYVVEGLGNANSLASASHGAGRVMSRRAAKENITMSQVRKQIEEAGVTLIGSGLDEAPDAYKDIDQVIAAQKDLVKVHAKFQPKIVRMDGDSRIMRGVEEEPGM